MLGNGPEMPRNGQENKEMTQNDLKCPKNF